MNKGAFTVETAVVMGIILTLVAVLIGLMFVLHDKNTLYALEQCYLRKAADEEEGIGNELLAVRFVSEANSWTYYLKVSGATLWEGDQEIILSYSVSLKGMNLSEFSFWTGNFIKEKGEACLTTTKRGADFVRLVHGLVFPGLE